MIGTNSADVDSVRRKRTVPKIEGEIAMAKGKSNAVRLITIILVILVVTASSVSGSRSALGVRAGWSFKPDQFNIGVQAELGRIFHTAQFAPSVDLGFGENHTVTAINIDLRWYLFPLPKTGIFFYGSAGPTIILDSPEKGDSQSDVGLSLTAGLKIPMKGGNRYNFEVRFGFGDIHELKLMFGILFGI